MAVLGGISVSQTQLVFLYYRKSKVANNEDDKYDGTQIYEERFLKELFKLHA